MATLRASLNHTKTCCEHRRESRARGCLYAPTKGLQVLDGRRGPEHSPC